MKFDRMPVEELKGALEQWFDSGESVFTIVLTDGIMLHADLQRPFTFNGQRQTVDEAWWNDAGIKVSISIDDDDDDDGGGGGVFHKVTVPFEEIAGITPLKLYEEVRSRKGFGFLIDDRVPGAPPKTDLPYEESSREVLELDLFEKARRHGFPIESFRYGPSVGIAATIPPTYGPPDPSSDTFLYGDWEFFQRRAGGLRSLGFGVPWGSASVGWERSLWADMRRQIKRRPVEFEKVYKRKNYAVLRGFPILFEFNKLRSAERKKYAQSMDGQIWWPLVISRERTAGQAPTGPWVYALTREALFDFWPREFWERIPTPIRFYGEVIHAPVETQFGHADYVLRARAAAVLVKDKTL